MSEVTCAESEASLFVSVVLIIPLVDRDEAKVISLILVSSVSLAVVSDTVLMKPVIGLSLSLHLSHLFSSEPMDPEFRRMNVRGFCVWKFVIARYF